MRNTYWILIISAIVAAMVSYGVAGRTPASTKAETAFERVERTGTLRCGYILWPPYLLKDPNTGEMSGIAYDYMQVLAQELGLHVSWTEETGFGNYAEGLNTGRYDAVCTPVWLSGPRARAAMLSRPLFYDKMMALVRADDHRFDLSLSAINKPDVRVAVVEGDLVENVSRIRFPQVQKVALTPTADSSQLILNVATNKADVAFDTLDNLVRYNAHADRKLKIAANGEAVQLCANVLAVRQGEISLKTTLDGAIEAINDDGRAQAIVQKYGEGFRSVAGP